MSTTFPLPLECLQIIIHHLNDQLDHSSLTSLLCVNKYVCAATLPILFQDPCNMRPLNPSYGGHDPILRGRRKLFRLLLRSLSFNCDLITDILFAVFFMPDTDEDQFKGQDEVSIDLEARQDARILAKETLQTSPSTFFPYFSFISKVTFEKTIFALPGLLLTTDFLGFLKRNGYSDRYMREDSMIYSHFPNTRTKVFDIAKVAEREIRMDLAWAFCSANAENIQTLHLSIADIERYKPLIPRFIVLADITFQIDKNLKAPPSAIIEITEDLSKIFKKLKKDRERHLKEMIEFVENHQYYHPKVLKTAQCANDRAPEESCPEQYQTRLFQLLPPLTRPLYIDYRNWHHFITHFSDTDLSYVKSIDLVHDLIETSEGYQKLKKDLFLQRCHSLEKISLKIPDENIFNWAVQVRRDVINKTDMAKLSSRLPFPLREYYARFDQASTGRQVRDILFAFNNTLEKVVLDFSHNSRYVRAIPNFEFGEDTIEEDDNLSFLQFPRLEELNICTIPYTHLRLHPTFLARSPNLKAITLTDIERFYSLADAVFWKPAKLHNLVDLVISGAPVYSFHPDTFKSTHMLEKLVVEGRSIQEEDLIIGDSENNYSISTSISKQPVWTWDWNFPNLTCLYLTQDFALQFRFQLFKSTPQLMEVSLEIPTFITRTIMVTELIKPGFRHPCLDRFLKREGQDMKTSQREWKHVSEGSMTEWFEYNGNGHEDNSMDDDVDNNEIWREFEYVHVPNLRTLTLAGAWTMDYRLLFVIFGKVAPHIKQLRFYGCDGFSLTEWVKSTSHHLHELTIAHINIPFTPEMIVDAGLAIIPSTLGLGSHYELIERPERRLLDSPTIYFLSG